MSSQEFSKVLIPQNITESKAALLQDFFPMNNKQELGVGLFFANPFKVKRCNYCFACTGGSNDQVFIPLVDFTLGADFIKDFLLIGVRRNIHKRHEIFFVFILAAFVP